MQMKRTLSVTIVLAVCGIVSPVNLRAQGAEVESGAPGVRREEME